MRNGNITQFGSKRFKPGNFKNGNFKPGRVRHKKRVRGGLRRDGFWALILLCAIVGLLRGPQTDIAAAGMPGGELISCHRPYIIDGDTLTCGGVRIRLSSIDTPEMPGHCKAGRRCTPGDPFAARDYLKVISDGEVACRPIEEDRYGRTVAACSAGGVDLSCEMVRAGHAVERYGRLSCT